MHPRAPGCLCSTRMRHRQHGVWRLRRNASNGSGTSGTGDDANAGCACGAWRSSSWGLPCSLRHPKDRKTTDEVSSGDVSTSDWFRALAIQELDADERTHQPRSPPTLRRAPLQVTHKPSQDRDLGSGDQCARGPQVNSAAPKSPLEPPPGPLPRSQPCGPAPGRTQGSPRPRHREPRPRGGRPPRR